MAPATNLPIRYWLRSVRIGLLVTVLVIAVLILLPVLPNEAHIQIYGWVNFGGNVSTNTVKPGGNWPAAYMYTPNTAQLDQAVVYIERLPDTVQKDHVDWGFRLSAMYGENYRYTTAYGLAGWFDAELAEGVGFGTGPFSPSTHWQQMGFPLPGPFPIDAGLPLHVRIEPITVEDDRRHWRWSVRQGRREVTQDEVASKPWAAERNRP